MLAIYRDLRVGMVVLMVMLAAGVIIEKISGTLLAIGHQHLLLHLRAQHRRRRARGTRHAIHHL